jgi:glycosyltransferase involved in cell wall biosynthesis
MQQEQERPRVSIAMATYNGERFLPEQLESFLTQTRRPDELVVCDDNSTDATLDILREFAARAPFPVRIQPNPARLGWRENFFKAASLCEGDWIAFSDQDDVWLPEKLERCLGALIRSGALLAVHQAEVVDQHLKRLGRLQPDLPRHLPRDPSAWVPWDIVQGFCMVVSSELFRIYPWQQRPDDFRCPGQPYSHDGWVVLLSQALGRVTLLHEALCLYRQHGGNAVGAPVYDWSKLVRKAPAVGFGAYRERARSALTCARYLESLADVMAGAGAEKLRAAAASYRRRARLYWWRAQVYHPLHGGLGRLREFTLLNLRAAYRAASLGGLGGRSFLKDLLFGVLARREGPGTTGSGQ